MAKKTKTEELRYYPAVDPPKPPKAKKDKNLGAQVTRLSKELEKVRDALYLALEKLKEKEAPIPMRIVCPDCSRLHIDEGEFATKPHHTHSCQHCGLTWRPAIVNTVGVQFLPGFKSAAPHGG